MGYKINLNPFQNKPVNCLQCKSFENTVGKGEIVCYEQFLLFPHTVFSTLLENFLPFPSNSELSSAKSFSLDCKLFQFGRV